MSLLSSDPFSFLTTNGNATVVTFAYDAANRLLWEDQTVAGMTHRVQHDRDHDGNAINTQATGGYLIWYHYNQRTDSGRRRGAVD